MACGYKSDKFAHGSIFWQNKTQLGIWHNANDTDL